MSVNTPFLQRGTPPGGTTPKRLLSPLRSTTSATSGYRRFLEPSSRTPLPSPRRRFEKQRPVTAPNDKVRPRTPREGVTKGKGRTISTLLPPRKVSSISTVEGDSPRVERKGDSVKIERLHFSYLPHKAFWIKNAIQNLGTEWVRSGKITLGQLRSPEFEEKMAVLYDLAMARKHEAIDRLVHEPMGEEPGKRRTRSKEVQKNFPFAVHVDEKVKESMSENLLRIMMRDKGVKGEHESSLDKGKGKKVAEEKKKDPEEDTSTSNSFDRSLKKRKRSLLQCYIDNGRLVLGTKDKMLSVGGSFVNKFGESRLSRARRSPSAEGGVTYFRKTCNLMGFENSEINIRYCKNSRSLIVSGCRPKRGNENARQVRETIEIPKSVNIGNIMVLRTSRGSLIVEELEELLESNA